MCSLARVSEVHAPAFGEGGGTVPTGVAELTAVARRVKPDAVVWRGDAQLPVQSQGVRVLGTPIGRPEYVEDFLVRKSSDIDILFTRILAVEDLQSGWGHAGEFLAADSQTRFDSFVCRTPRRQCLAMHGAVEVSGSVGVVPNTGIIDIPVGRYGFGPCSEGQRGRPLGQLGRLHQNGEAAPSTHRSNNDASLVDHDPVAPCFREVRSWQGSTSRSGRV